MLKVQAFAKINLALDVLGKRQDGYHEVAMVMQSIGLADELTLSSTESAITISTDAPGLETDSGNLVYRAADLLRKSYNVCQGVHVHINKVIPIAAGLAGGSADAAAALAGLNQLWRLGLHDADLAALAAQIGSDVPFCLSGGTALATGRGEKLKPLPPLPPCWVVLAKPTAAVSTAWVYGNYREIPGANHPDLAGMVEALAKRNLRGVASRLGNMLETVTIPAYPEIERLKRKMVEYGAMASLMSGSGPTVFGLTDTFESAGRIAGRLSQDTEARILIAQIP